MQQEHALDFRNFTQDDKYISADMFINGEFVVKFTDFKEHIWKNTNLSITLYKYFIISARDYISINSIDNTKIIINQSLQTHQ